MVLTQPPSAICSRMHAQRRQREWPQSPGVRRDRQRRTLAQRQPDQQCQQPDTAEQMHGDDQRLQLLRHRQRAECSLHTDPQERCGCEPRRRRGGRGASPAPRLHREDDDQQADAHREITMQHLDPGLGHCHRPARLRGLGSADRFARRQRIRMPVAARPVRTTEARVGQTSEGAEHDQVERQERGDPGQLAKLGRVARQRDVRQRQRRDGDALRRQPEERLRLHQSLRSTRTQ